MTLFGLTGDDLYVVLAGGAAFLAVLAAGRGFVEYDARARRLKMVQERRAELRGEAVRSRRRKRQQNKGHVDFMRRVVDRFRLLKSKEVSGAQQLLTEAGWRTKDALVVFMFFSLVSPIAFGILGIALAEMHIWGEGKMAKFRFFLPMLLIYFGLKLPTLVAAWKRRRRYRAIRRALSDTLDLMTICAEAGLTLAVTLERVSRELGIAYPQMAEELALTAVEMGLLPDRERAFANLTERVRMPEIRGITSVLMQTEKYGTPVAQALRVLSAEFREQRMLAAENKAARLGPLMTIPMICFILPTMFIVVMTPAILRVLERMK